MSFDQITSPVSGFFRKNGGTILTGLSVLGVIGTAVLSGIAAVKAHKELETLKDAPLPEKIKALTPVYIPPAAAGTATILCVLGANGLNRKQQASMLAAGAVAEEAFRKYKGRAEELLGDKAPEAYLAEDPPNDVPLDKDKRLFYYNYYQDGEYPEYGSYFESTPENVLHAELELNRIFILRKRATLNDFFDLLGLKHVEGGDNLGWSEELGSLYYGYSWVDFEHYDAKLEDGLECTIISTPSLPTILE